jgi:hypothetical protein
MIWVSYLIQNSLTAKQAKMDTEFWERVGKIRVGTISYLL